MANKFFLIDKGFMNLRLVIFSIFLFSNLLNAEIITFPKQQLISSDAFGLKYCAVLPSTIFMGPIPSFLIDANIQSNVNKTFSEIVLFHSSALKYVGLTKGRGWCCTSQYYAEGLCSAHGKLALNFQATKIQKIEKSYFNSDLADIFYWAPESVGEVRITERIKLPHSGLWYFVVVNCFENETMETFEGNVTFSNPFGFLSGHLFARIPIHLSLATTYFGLTVVWVGLMILYNKNLVRMQYVMLLAMICGLAHEIVWGSYWYFFNSSGTSSNVLNIIGALLTTVKLTVIRTLILLLSLGHSILYETLDITPKLLLIFLTISYGTLLGTSEYLSVLEDLEIYIKPVVYTAIFGALTFVNGIYGIWIVFSLLQNIKILKSRSPKPKLQIKIYQDMSYGLLVAGLLCLVTFIVEGVLSYFNLQDPMWSTWWLFLCFWEYIYFFLTSFVSFIWRPNSKNIKFDLRHHSNSSDSSDSHMILQAVPPLYRYKKEPASPISFKSESEVSVVGKRNREEDSSEMDEVAL